MLKKIYKVRWIKKHFTEMSTQYRKARETVGGTLTTCFGCGCEFDDGDILALACLVEAGNKIICQSCAGNTTKDGE